ncbi:ABC transporter permease [Streptomyces lasalocidi]
MNALLTGIRLQLRIFRRDTGELHMLATIPCFTAIFLSSIRVAGRTDLEPYGVVAPCLMGVWLVSLNLGGSVIDSERSGGTLELFLAAPASFTRVLTGRVAAVSGLLAVTFAESWLTARAFFDAHVPLTHPGPLLATLLATSLATLGVSTVLAAVFVAAGSAPQYANALGYPFYVLSGVLIPVSQLPHWIQPVSKVVFLTWAADLLRDALAPAPVADFGYRIGALLLLGLVSYAAGSALAARMVLNLRRKGAVTLS